MAECCFCASAIDSNQKGPLALVAMSSACVGETDTAEPAALVPRPRCLSDRLAVKVPFDAKAFDE